MKKVTTVRTSAVLKALDAEKPAKSAWGRAVQADARDLVDELDGNGYEELPTSCAELDTLMLNGASDWSAYSWGGSALIYDEEIAEHYCTPSELERCRHGARRPNASEDWLDVQARALSQAARHVRAKVFEIARAAVREVA